MKRARKKDRKKDETVITSGTIIINTVTPEVPEGWELSEQVIRKEAPWKGDSAATAENLNKGKKNAKESPSSWDRGDMVSVMLDDDRHEQILVASDHPAVYDSSDESGPWIVVADNNNWDAVGTFRSSDYISEKDGRRIFRVEQQTAQTETSDATPHEPSPPRSRVLLEAEQLITGDRNKSYGSPTENFQNTADIWTIQVQHLLKEGARFEAVHVAQLMMGLKLARLVATPKRDNYVDIAGYAGCGWECEEATLNAAKASEPSPRRRVLIPDEWKKVAS